MPAGKLGEGVHESAMACKLEIHPEGADRHLIRGWLHAEGAALGTQTKCPGGLRQQLHLCLPATQHQQYVTNMSIVCVHAAHMAMIAMALPNSRAHSDASNLAVCTVTCMHALQQMEVPPVMRSLINVLPLCPLMAPSTEVQVWEPRAS